MKKLVIFSVCLAIFSTGAFAATPSQRRVSSSSDDMAAASSPTAARSATKTPSTTTAARSATRTTAARSATPTTSTAAPKATVSARAATSQKIINTGTKIQSASTNILADEMCQKQFNGCMDSFCMLENDSGGRCQCSDRKPELDKALVEIEKLDAQSYKMATEGVAKLEMGAGADSVIAAANKTVNDILNPQTEKPTRRSLDLSLWDEDEIISEIKEETAFELASSKESILDKTGNDLYTSAFKICSEQIPACDKDINMLKLMYAQNIKSDCTAYENELSKRQKASASKLAAAETALRETALKSYQDANKYDLGQCTTEFKKCMSGTGGCGDDFAGCVGIAAADNAKTSVKSKKSAKQYDIKGKYTKISIAASTMDTLLSKKTICENVTNSCVNVKNKVWDAFMADVGPTLKSAELAAESNLRWNCRSSIGDCMDKACKDTVDPNDPDGSYDMCLSRPEAVRSLCKVQIEPCEAIDPQIMVSVFAELEAKRTDACRAEAKACFTNENACGENFQNCIGLDFESMKKMCSFEKLIACQKDEKVKSMKDLDNFLYGLYLSFDNSMITQCQKLVDEKMLELCGATENCDSAFTDDIYIGTESLTSYKNNDGDFVISGLVSFGNVNVSKTNSTDSNVKFGTYEIDIQGYEDKLNEDGSINSTASRRVIGALESVANKIDQKIAILTSDSKINMCINGRDMTQISGRKGDVTQGRYPNLLASSILAVINSGMDKANENYGKKYNELVTAATEGQSDEFKAAMCASIAAEEKVCKRAEADEDGKCIEYKTNDSFQNLFSDSKKSQKGIIGTYETEYVISGAKLSDLIKAASSGKSEYTQVDKDGNMIGKISTTAVYSAENNTCNITTITTMCDNIDTIITTDKTKKGGITGGGSKTVESYQGTMCSSFKDPTTNTSTIEM